MNSLKGLWKTLNYCRSLSSIKAQLWNFSSLEEGSRMLQRGFSLQRNPQGVGSLPSLCHVAVWQPHICLFLLAWSFEKSRWLPQKFHVINQQETSVKLLIPDSPGGTFPGFRLFRHPQAQWVFFWACLGRGLEAFSEARVVLGTVDLGKCIFYLF